AVGLDGTQEVHLEVDRSKCSAAADDALVRAVTRGACKVRSGAAVQAPTDRAAQPLAGRHRPRGAAFGCCGTPDAAEARNRRRRQRSYDVSLQDLEAAQPLPHVSWKHLSLSRSLIRM